MRELLRSDGRLLPKHVGASIQNKGVVQSVHMVGHFYYCHELSGFTKASYFLNRQEILG
jgi:hypothetical protein